MLWCHMVESRSLNGPLVKIRANTWCIKRGGGRSEREKRKEGNWKNFLSSLVVHIERCDSESVSVWPLFAVWLMCEISARFFPPLSILVSCHKKESNYRHSGRESSVMSALIQCSIRSQSVDVIQCMHLNWSLVWMDHKLTALQIFASFLLLFELFIHTCLG